MTVTSEYVIYFTEPPSLFQLIEELQTAQELFGEHESQVRVRQHAMHARGIVVTVLDRRAE